MEGQPEGGGLGAVGEERPVVAGESDRSASAVKPGSDV